MTLWQIRLDVSSPRPSFILLLTVRYWKKKNFSVPLLCSKFDFNRIIKVKWFRGNQTWFCQLSFHWIYFFLLNWLWSFIRTRFKVLTGIILLLKNPDIRLNNQLWGPSLPKKIPDGFSDFITFYRSASFIVCIGPQILWFNYSFED